MLCPCRNCICLAICKIKPIRPLFRECSLLKDYARPYGTDVVSKKALKEINFYLKRSFDIIGDDIHDRPETVIRDLEQWSKIGL